MDYDSHEDQPMNPEEFGWLSPAPPIFRGKDNLLNAVSALVLLALGFGLLVFPALVIRVWVWAL